MIDWKDMSGVAGRQKCKGLVEVSWCLGWHLKDRTTRHNFCERY